MYLRPEKILTIRVSNDSFTSEDYTYSEANCLVLLDSVTYYRGVWNFSNLPAKFKLSPAVKFLQLDVNDELLDHNTEAFPSWYLLFQGVFDRGCNGIEFAFKQDKKLFVHDQSLLNALLVLKNWNITRYKNAPAQMRFGLIVDDWAIQEEKVLRQWLLRVDYAVIKAYGYFNYTPYSMLNGSAKRLLPKSDSALASVIKQLDKIPNDLQTKCLLGFSTGAVMYKCKDGNIEDVSDVYRKDIYHSIQLLAKSEAQKYVYEKNDATFEIKDETSTISMECSATVIQKLNYFIGFKNLGGVYLENPIYDLPSNHHQSIYQKYLQWKSQDMWVNEKFFDIWQTPQHTLFSKRNEMQDQLSSQSLSSKKPKLTDEGYSEKPDHETGLFQMEDV